MQRGELQEVAKPISKGITKNKFTKRQLVFVRVPSVLISINFMCNQMFQLFIKNWNFHVYNFSLNFFSPRNEIVISFFCLKFTASGTVGVACGNVLSTEGAEVKGQTKGKSSTHLQQHAPAITT